MSVELTTDRIFQYKRLAWARWMFGVIVAVFVACLIMGTTIRENAYDGCLRSTADRYAEAQSWQAAHDREALLSATTLGAEADTHGASAIQAQKTADDLMSRTDSRVQGRQDFCHKAYPPIFGIFG